MAMNVGRDLPEALVFSCMAVGKPGLAALDSWPARPGVVEWMPRLTKPGSHPDWKPDGLAFRDPVTGRVVPRLLQMFGRSEPLRLAAFGFSAGSNSGVRELLRSPSDRESLSFVAAVDGLHAALSNPVLHVPSNPKSYFLDWKGQMEPFVEYAIQAARGQCTMVLTGNDLAEPAAGLTRTPYAIRRLMDYVESQPDIEEYDQDTARAFADLGAPLPLQMFGRGKLYCFTYGGTRKEDHIAQAKVVVPRIIDMFLKKLWAKEAEA